MYTEQIVEYYNNHYVKWTASKYSYGKKGFLEMIYTRKITEAKSCQ